MHFFNRIAEFWGENRANPLLSEGFDDFSTNDAQKEKRSQGRKIGPIMQRTSINGKIELATHEGIVLERYKDSVDVWTIGIGVTEAAGANINPETYKDSITVRHALDMLDEVLPQYEAIVHSLLNNQTVPQYVFDGLVCAAYNLGPKFGRGKLTRKYIGLGQYRRALVMWRNAGGKPSTAILARRHKEATLIETGVYSNHLIPLYDGKGRHNTPRRIGDITPQRLRAMMQPTTRSV